MYLLKFQEKFINHNFKTVTKYKLNSCKMHTILIVLLTYEVSIKKQVFDFKLLFLDKTSVKTEGGKITEG